MAKVSHLDCLEQLLNSLHVIHKEDSIRFKLAVDECSGRFGFVLVWFVVVLAGPGPWSVVRGPWSVVLREHAAAGGIVLHEMLRDYFFRLQRTPDVRFLSRKLEMYGFICLKFINIEKQFKTFLFLMNGNVFMTADGWDKFLNSHGRSLATLLCWASVSFLLLSSYSVYLQPLFKIYISCYDLTWFRYSTCMDYLNPEVLKWCVSVTWCWSEARVSATGACESAASVTRR